jgi:hypothetical protein
MAKLRLIDTAHQQPERARTRAQGTHGDLQWWCVRLTRLPGGAAALAGDARPGMTSRAGAGDLWAR